MTYTSQKIRELRLKNNWSIDHLAQQSKVSKTSIWELENRPERKPTIDLLKAIADGLNVDIDTLIKEPGTEEEENQEKEFFRKFKKLNAKDKEVIEDMMKSLAKRRESN